MLEEVLHLLRELPVEDRRRVFDQLRAEFGIHPLEADLNTEAEVILEAIHRAGGLVLRMMRGVIAEAAFALHVVQELDEWEDVTPEGDHAYDFALEDAQGMVRVQVKLQRSTEGRPTRGSDVRRRERAFGEEMYIVETQKTRRGNRDGANTRPYRFGEFDILAVSMYPATGRWDSFMYTVGDWLLPRPGEPGQLRIYQPIPPEPNEDWTNDFEEVVRRWRSGERRTISSGVITLPL